MKGRKKITFRILFALGIGCLAALLFGCGRNMFYPEGIRFLRDTVESRQECGSECSGEDIGPLLSPAESGAESSSEETKEFSEDPEFPCGSDKDPEEGAKPDGDNDPGSLKKERSGMILVHVCGAVQKSGVYAIPEDSRIVDAVEAAGGFAPDAAPDYINMAQRLFDGSKVIIPTFGEVAEEPYGQTVLTAGMTETESKVAGEWKVNINTADAKELTRLPGVGSTRAEAIVRYRSREGAFTCAEDLTKVPGIGESIFRNLKDHVSIE